MLLILGIGAFCVAGILMLTLSLLEWQCTPHPHSTKVASPWQAAFFNLSPDTSMFTPQPKEKISHVASPSVEMQLAPSTILSFYLFITGGTSPPPIFQLFYRRETPVFRSRDRDKLFHNHSRFHSSPQVALGLCISHYQKPSAD